MRSPVRALLLSLTLLATLALAPAAWATPNPGPITPTGKAVTADTPLKVGDRVEVEWSGSWYAGEILELKADGKVKIHYTGWASSYDEAVVRTRLRKP